MMLLTILHSYFVIITLKFPLIWEFLQLFIRQHIKLIYDTIDPLFF